MKTSYAPVVSISISPPKDHVCGHCGELKPLTAVVTSDILSLKVCAECEARARRLIGAHVSAPFGGLTVRLLIALLFLVVSIRGVAAQEIAAAIYSGTPWAPAYPSTIFYAVCAMSPVDVFSINTVIPIQAEWVYAAPGWQAYFENGDIIFVADDGYEVQPGTCSDWFTVWGPSIFFTQADAVVGGVDGIHFEKVMVHQ